MTWEGVGLREGLGRASLGTIGRGGGRLRR